MTLLHRVFSYIMVQFNLCPECGSDLVRYGTDRKDCIACNFKRYLS